MRRLLKRKSLDSATKQRLSAITVQILANADPKDFAESRYRTSRRAVWFSPVIAELKRMSGKGGRCMYCSGSEASDVEHYRPISANAGLAFTWKNFLWVCTPCNRKKSDQFPLAADNSPMLIDPTVENVWDYFFIDKFGFLVPKWDLSANAPNARAKETIRVLDLNREAVQESRLARHKRLVRDGRRLSRGISNSSLSVSKAKAELRSLIGEPFQPDVADFLLRGPGKATAPFKKLYAKIA